jgi:hypothetical protein
LDCSVGTSSSVRGAAGGADLWVVTSKGELASGSAGAGGDTGDADTGDAGTEGTAGVGGSGLDAPGWLAG